MTQGPTPAPGAAAAWHRALDGLEQDLDVLAAALDAGEPVLPAAWQPPADLGAMPEEVAPRATALLGRLTGLQQRMRGELTALRDELNGLGHRRQAGLAYAMGGPAEG